MKKRLVAMMLVMASVMCLSGCDKEAETAASDAGQPKITVIEAEPLNKVDEPSDSAENTEAVESSEESKPAEPVSIDGKYRSELTGEWIPEELKNQRPIAVTVDNELTALDHYGVNSADVVYEIMNSTMNGRVTRLMVIVKDWEKIQQLGSVRSARPTNFLLAAEYNAILCHDGGPFFIDDYVAKGYTNNLSGGFARFSNGKATEFTEYITYEDYKNPTTGKSYDGLKDRIAAAKYSTEYNSYYPGAHFAFNYDGVDLSSNSQATDAKTVKLPFPHNSSKLVYNESTGSYEYYEYGKSHIDPMDGDAITSFKNLIIYSCSFHEYGEGYMIYNVIGSGSGYYVTGGKAIPITWSKTSEEGITSFTDATTGKTLELTPGKVYVAIVPDDKWSELSISGN